MTSTTLSPAEAFGTAPEIEKVHPNAVVRVKEGDLQGAFTALLGISVLALVATAIGYFIAGGNQFFVSYLTGYMYTLAIVLGGLFFVMIQHITRAGWSVTVRRVAECVMANFTLLAVLFIPVALGAGTLYGAWMDAPASDTLVKGKDWYLNTPFFWARAVFYFLVWIGLSRFFFNRSLKQDENGDPGLTISMAGRAAPGLALFAITTTFAAIDWIMVIDPHWFSTMFGVCYFAAGAMGVLATISLLCLFLNRSGYLNEFVNREHYHDLGKLLFAFMVFWTYVNFSQYMLIWYANLPEETAWYEVRRHGGWQWVGATLIVGHFLFPFAFLMSRHMKRNRVTLTIGALLLLVMHWLDMQYQIQPALLPQAAGHEWSNWNLHWMDVTALVGIFGLVLAFTVRRIAANPLVPVRDPRLPESIHFHNI